MVRTKAGGAPGRAHVRAAALGGEPEPERGRLTGFQRARLLSAAVDAAAHKGAANVTVADILTRAGVSRRTFYELFADRKDCLRAAFENALQTAAERVLPAYASGASWRESLRAGLVALVRFIEQEPKLARLLLFDSQSIVSVWPSRRRAVAALIEAVAAGGSAGRGENREPPPALAVEGLVGGALAVLGRVADRPEGESTQELVNSIMAMVVLPYLGAAAARRELGESVKPVKGGGGAHGGARALAATDPFRALGMRLTYRTVRVIAAIGDEPGASNRRVGNLAGISDQGQISKLLRRLERLGVIEEDPRSERGPGAPNAWVLTDAGHGMMEGIRAHAEPLDGHW